MYNHKHALWPQTYDNASVSFILLCSACVFFMIPGLGFLYSGLARRKSALALIWVVLMATVVGMIQWYFWGYSLAFSLSAPDNKFIGNLDSFGFRNVYGTKMTTASDGSYPELAFAIFQMMFLCVTLSIVAGATAERGRLLPHMLFLFFFATAVYCPITYWIWAPGGWCYRWGVLDWAGGGPVEIVSAVAGFVYSYFLGRRKENLLINFRPHNVSMVTLGTGILWFGWLLFNGGTSLAPNLRSVYAFMNTNLSAAMGGIVWCLIDFRLERKWSTVGLCSGLICGLVAATPSSGCIPLYGSIVQGVVAGVVCNFATKIKYYLKVDDALDLLAEHGIAGVIGLLFNAIFGADWVIGLDGTTYHHGGWISHNWKQIYKQIAYIGAVAGYCAACTAVLCIVIDKIPGLQLRVDEEAERNGLDEDQIGEFAYDYVEVRRDYYQWGVDNDYYWDHRNDENEDEEDDDEEVDESTTSNTYTPKSTDEDDDDSTTIESDTASSPESFTPHHSHRHHHNHSHSRSHSRAHSHHHSYHHTKQSSRTSNEMPDSTSMEVPNSNIISHSNRKSNEILQDIHPSESADLANIHTSDPTENAQEIELQEV
ncbi:hypothetical protein TBLA_0C03920 [Henningerozyma blattae CBS 6284]|uniref:Ammonium transporter n=1 Tax=Henningerozyma blattae (strain ATCC 34711 / CBS 6284 / DSM 70876 / NBRC 10599 / NRRL Y-10934 / UCD 77-7) TaxID=1071380 RepID=I2H1E1_HENB6|nr:hypothetical protein TBLA_0C03920 [Tetrapisispora blattae CBS 6284]CCH60193.1 hypothetical protein TBLA_0C03920 [Tetrapisispora blattae CBS 6284]